MKTDLYLVRHGQPTLENALLGVTDPPLSSLGWQQLEKTFERLEYFDYLISSPLARCSAFAKEYIKKQTIEKNYKIIENWKECNFGDWDGKTFTELQQQFPQEIASFYKQPFDNGPANSEPLADFCTRVELALMELLTEYKNKQLVVLTHGGVIRTLVAWCLKMDYQTGYQFKTFSIDYASITHISIYQDEKYLNSLENLYPKLISLNHYHSR
ncbi:MAG: histidine phosphatase family protein [Gammaproteobacteria bacterium]|nr:histidine phosphatase family protein [Gammaproteobacteria bacterium]